MSNEEAGNHAAAIKAIYSYLKGNRAFGELILDLEAYLLTPRSDGPAIPASLDAHFEIAGDLAADIAPSPLSRYRPIIEGPGCRFAVDGDMKVVACSPAAMERLVRREAASRETAMDQPGTIALSRPLRAAIAEIHAAAQAGDPDRRRIVADEQDGEQVFVSVRHDRDLGVVVLTYPDEGWRDGVYSLLQASLGLSPSECEVLGHMMAGLSNTEISRERGRSAETIKSQTQSIFRKLGVTSRVEAVRVVSDLASLTALSGNESPPAGKGAAAGHHYSFAARPDGWGEATIGGRRIGRIHHRAKLPAQGKARTVLMLHGLTQGPEITPFLADRLTRSGLDYLGLSKPGYGVTDPAGNEDYVERTIADCLAVMDHAGIDRVVVLAHMFGTLPGIEFCIRHPDRVIGMLICSGYFPLQLNPDFTPRGAVQKLVTHTGIGSAAAHQFIARIGYAYLRYGGARAYLASLFERSPRDMSLLDDPVVGPIHFAGLRHMMQNGVAAFLADTGSGRHDWSNRLDLCTVPTVLLHGSDDPAVNPDMAKLAASRFPNGRFEAVPGRGQTVLHSEPDLMVRHLLDLAGVTSSMGRAAAC